jgi:hypothetical protein
LLPLGSQPLIQGFMLVRPGCFYDHTGVRVAGLGNSTSCT